MQVQLGLVDGSCTDRSFKWLLTDWEDPRFRKWPNAAQRGGPLPAQHQTLLGILDFRSYSIPSSTCRDLACMHHILLKALAGLDQTLHAFWNITSLPERWREYREKNRGSFCILHF
jgi:hypothetical protein